MMMGVDDGCINFFSNRSNFGIYLRYDKLFYY